MEGIAASRDLALLRLVSQRLAGPRPASALDVVRHLGAVQAQDLPGALTSVALRVSDAATSGDVRTALDAGDVVRTWPMRGTLHLVPAADAAWMVSITGRRTTASIAKRRAEVGIDDAAAGRAREIAEAALGGGRSMERAELFDLWRAAGLLVHSQTGVHLLGELARHGVLVLGPTSGAGQRVVLLAEWVPRPVLLDRTEGLAEWVRRYVRGHGPVTDRDVARWIGVTLTDVREALAAVAGELDTLEVDGVTHVLDPAVPDLLTAHRAEARRLLLLPGFDEFMLGYGDRSFAVPPEHLQRIVPGGNGMFRATIVKGGEVIGVWTRAGSGTRRTIRPEPFGTLSARDLAGVERLFRELP